MSTIRTCQAPINRITVRLSLTLLLLMLSSVTIAQQRRTGNPVLDSLISQKDSIGIQKKLSELSNGSEKDMVSVYNYYMYDLSKKNAVSELIIKRYPKSDFAYYKQQGELYRDDDPEKRARLLQLLKKAFPDRELDGAYAAVSNAYARANDIAKAKAYLAMIKGLQARQSAIAANARDLINSNPAAADEFLEPEIGRLKKEGALNDEKLKGRYIEFATLYGLVLIKERKYGKALEYVRYAYNNTIRKDLHLNSAYALVLSKTDNDAEALPFLTKLVDDGKADQALRSAFMKSYHNVYPDRNGATYLQKTESEILKKTEVSFISNMIDSPSPAFELKDVHGKVVTLQDFKGKIIVLDFWSTWCGPCKASFPSMQRLVNDYKDDPDVHFLFVHTLEATANPLPAAQKYLKDNHYKFDLYIDPKDPQTKKNTAVTAFKINGIPTKIIIDAKGNLRFQMLGFSGSDDDAVREISAMINLVKKNS